MGRGDRRTVGRASVPLTPVLRDALAHPARFGLRRVTSVASALVELAERGAEAGKREAFEAAELRAYAAYEADRERQAVAGAEHEAALKSGAV